MRDLIFIPIEPLEERYTEQWYRNFPKELSSYFNVTTIDGTTLEDTVKVGAFLDINSTTHYKWTQLQQISKLFHKNKIKEDTIFFFADMEFWGLEGVRLLAQMNNINIKIAAFLHAASYTIGDAFSIASPYQKYTELGWAAVCDKILVGSNYHKRAFIERRVKPIVPDQENYFSEKIKVTLNPIFKEEFPVFGTSKKNKVILTNRLDKEKNPLRTLQLFSTVRLRHPEIEFIITSSRSDLRGDPETIELAKTLEAAGIITIKVGLSKREYYRELSEALIIVSHSPEENFGYCLAEGLFYDVVPFYRYCASHPELVNNIPYCLFNDEDVRGQIDGLSRLIEDSELRSKFISVELPIIKQTLQNGLPNIISELKSI